MIANTKLGELIGVLKRDPLEFCDRVSAVMQVRLDRLRSNSCRLKPITLIEAIHLLKSGLPATATPNLQESALSEIEQQVSQRVAKLGPDSPFQLFHNGDSVLARLCYIACRLLRPAVALETGVAYGVTSAFILQALKINQHGALVSIDLPPLGRNGDSYVGVLIPEELKERWRLFRGPAKRLIPRLLVDLPEIDLFVHDSLHTCRNMMMEFNLIWPRLRPGGILIADDIEGNDAFERFTRTVQPALSVVFAEEGKNALCGLMVKST
jgi:hypothetical protein